MPLIKWLTKLLHLVPSVIRNMTKFIIWIVEDSGECLENEKACLKHAVDKVFQNDGDQSYWAETLHQGEQRVSA